jgi:hypothetical protein
MQEMWDRVQCAVAEMKTLPEILQSIQCHGFTVLKHAFQTVVIILRNQCSLCDYCFFMTDCKLQKHLVS